MYQIDISRCRDRMKLITQVLLQKKLRIRPSYGSDSQASVHLRDGYITFNPKLINEVLNHNEAEINLHFSGLQSKPWQVEEYYITYLTLHEVAHIINSVHYSDYVALEKKSNQNILSELKSLVCNIVEDCVIEDMLKQQYPVKAFKIPWELGTYIHVGDLALSDYKHNMPNFGVKDMLMYFLFRGQLPDNKDVQTCWNFTQYLPWSQETLDKFDMALTYVDPIKRAEYTLTTLVESVDKDLQALSEEFMKQLLNGQPDTPENRKKALENAIKAALQEMIKQINASGKPGTQGLGGTDNDLSYDRHDNDASYQTPMTDKEHIERSVEDFDNGILPADMIVQNLEDAAIDANNEAPVAKLSTLNKTGTELYQNVGPEFGRIHNEENYMKSGLDDGSDVDEDRLSGYYTEKDLGFFVEEINVKETKKIQVTFMLDASYSMEGTRFDSAINVASVLCHAFEEADIRTQVYMFDSSTYKLKDFTQPATWFSSGQSNVLLACQQQGIGGSTIIIPALENYVRQDINKTDNTINLLFIITDGAICDKPRAQELVNQIYQSGAYVKVIGIDFNQYDVDGTAEWVNKDDILSYSTDELTTRLGVDIANFVDDIVHHKI